MRKLAAISFLFAIVLSSLPAGEDSAKHIFSSREQGYKETCAVADDTKNMYELRFIAYPAKSWLQQFLNSNPNLFAAKLAVDGEYDLTEATRKMVDSLSPELQVVIDVKRNKLILRGKGSDMPYLYLIYERFHYESLKRIKAKKTDHPQRGSFGGGKE